FVFNDATSTWTGPVGPSATCGIVGPEADKLLLGLDDTVWGTGRVTQERKGNNPSYLDYADADFAATIASVASTTELTLVDATDVEVGDVITQTVGGTLYVTKVAAVDGLDITVFEAGPWAAGACTVYKGYDWVAQFQPRGSPAARMTLTRLQFLFKPEWYSARTGKALLMTDQIQAEKEVDMSSVGFGSSENSGGGGYGATPFGDPTPLMVDVNPLDPKWTNAAQFFIGMKTREAWFKVKLQGFGAQFMTADGPAARGSR
ncbi:MAG TPA: hypothetical protein VNN79_09360, partial [Actinomycetota bacterium]|nr:hypothetical protein [Actinomycetota bacterium]